MINGGIAQPKAFTPWMIIAHFQFLGWACLALLRPLEVVIIIAAIIMPIIKPVSLKLYKSSLRILYLTLTLYIRVNYSRIIIGSSHLAL